MFRGSLLAVLGSAVTPAEYCNNAWLISPSRGRGGGIQNATMADGAWHSNVRSPAWLEEPTRYISHASRLFLGCDANGQRPQVCIIVNTPVPVPVPVPGSILLVKGMGPAGW